MDLDELSFRRMMYPDAPWIAERRKPTVQECVERQRQVVQETGLSGGYHEWGMRNGLFNQFQRTDRAITV